MINLIFTGDICFRKNVFNLAQSDECLSDLKPILNEADFRIENLENSLADEHKHTPIIKAGPNHIASQQNIAFLRAAKLDGVSLANNHMGDYGDEAIFDTIELLDNNQILHTGAGKNIYDAYVPMRFIKNNISVSVFAVCEHEFGLADVNKAGTAKIDLRLLLRQ